MEQYYQQTIENVARNLQTDISSGLSQGESDERIRKYGANEIAAKKPKTKIQVFLSQLKDPLIYILLAAAAISIFLKEAGDAIIILAVVVLNAIIGMSQESKAEKALEAIQKMSQPMALVKRDGKITQVAARDITVGDVVVLEAGGLYLPI